MPGPRTPQRGDTLSPPQALMSPILRISFRSGNETCKNARAGRVEEDPAEPMTLVDVPTEHTTGHGCGAGSAGARRRGRSAAAQSPRAVAGGRLSAIADEDRGPRTLPIGPRPRERRPGLRSRVRSKRCSSARTSRPGPAARSDPARHRAPPAPGPWRRPATRHEAILHRDRTTSVGYQLPDQSGHRLHSDVICSLF
jgi:hypothetical protein